MCDNFMELVTIIIPVYNVEKYIDECIESVVNQTYTNIEILLINDGTTDISGEKCTEWQKRDERIRFISKKNEGLGPTRNLGVNLAKGKWIFFLDADDWIARDCIEKMIFAGIKNNAELVRCNYFQVNTDKKIKKTSNMYEQIGFRKNDDVCIFHTAPTIWNMLFYKDYYSRFNISQPNCKTQDFAVSLNFSLLANKIAYVDEPLYFYRKGRVGALTTGKCAKRRETAEIALPWLINLLKENGVYSCNYIGIYKCITYQLSILLFGGWMNLEDKEYNELMHLYINKANTYINYRHKIISCLGSWNLVDMARNFNYIQNMQYIFNISSLISIMSERININQEICTNLYRNKMIKIDINSGMWDIFDKVEPNYFIFDLIEERNNILNIDGNFITENECVEKVFKYNKDFVLIESGSNEWFNLWYEACDQFFEKIRRYIRDDSIIMVKLYLCEKYGKFKDTKEYANLEEIRKKNCMIKKCYNYIENKYKNIKVVEVPIDEYYMTDEKFEYGVYPWYINSLVSRRISEVLLVKKLIV